MKKIEKAAKNIIPSLTGAILTTVFCFPPLGIVAIFYVLKAAALARTGQYKLAGKYAKIANKLSFITLLAGIILYTIVIGWLICRPKPLSIPAAWHNTGSIVEGRLTEISQLPNPADSAYPDCYYTAKFLAENIREGKAVPQESVLVIPGFYNYKPDKLADLGEGKLELLIIPFEELSAKDKSIQQADDLNLFELENYFVLDAREIAEFSDLNSGILFSDIRQHRSVYQNPVNPPISAQAAATKEAFIQRDLTVLKEAVAKIEGNIDRINADFKKIWSQRQQQYELLPKNVVWANLDGSFFAFPADRELINPVEFYNNNVEAIKNFKDFLEANGVQFILNLVPNQYDVAARAINPEFKELADYNLAQAAIQLMDAGVETIYTTSAILENYPGHELMFFYPYDDHPADGAQEVMTDLLIERLERFKKSLTDNRIQSELFENKMLDNCNGGKFFWPQNADINGHKPGSKIKSRYVFYDGKEVPSNAESKILIIGNSFMQTPMEHGAYPAYLASKINYLPQYVEIANFGPMTTIPQLMFNNPEKYLKDKLLVVMTLGLDYLTERDFLDIRKLDREKLALNGKKLIGQIDLAPLASSPESIENALDKITHKPSSKAWRRFFAKNSGVQIVISTPESPLRFAKLPLPDNLDPQKEILLLVNATNAMLMQSTITINGIPQKIPYAYAINWYTLLYNFAPGISSLELEISSEDADSLMALKNILLYQ